LDILDQCIAISRFPQIDKWTCSFCTADLGIIDDEAVGNWTDHLELDHRVIDSGIFPLYQFLGNGTPDFECASFGMATQFFLNMKLIG
jgi:hypothetical protein